MEPKNSLPYSQVSATCPWARKIQSKNSNPISLRSALILFSHLSLGFLRKHFLTDFPTEVL
jgi:hypothetical protein